MATKKQQWLDYLAELTLYREQVKAYAHSLSDDTTAAGSDSGENPPPGLPPKPPA